MGKHRFKDSAFYIPRALLAFALCSGGVALSLLSFKLPVHPSNEAQEKSALRYMPEPGGKADDFSRMEQGGEAQ